MTHSKSQIALAAWAFLYLATVVWGQYPAPTTITVPDMHCASCAKRIAAHVYQVPGVGEVRVGVATTTLTVNQKGPTAPSARDLWEAVEKAGYRPSKLDGPSGSYTKKPQS